MTTKNAHRMIPISFACYGTGGPPYHTSSLLSIAFASCYIYLYTILPIIHSTQDTNPLTLELYNSIIAVSCSLFSSSLRFRPIGQLLRCFHLTPPLILSTFTCNSPYISRYHRH
ncbi:hypothetical protein BDN72DRAFT_544209 [Pluteus cervinus]|uniref:Uncharacterized protein n=1 Tax=Pluteus cervinus TaxID=181527 RepID=A0ACD3AXX6_9AGAR|nr:hypothetical protein BDN72DRAFT_544209 [Pluteus cervinus]